MQPRATRRTTPPTESPPPLASCDSHHARLHRYVLHLPPSLPDRPLSLHVALLLLLSPIPSTRYLPPSYHLTPSPLSRMSRSRPPGDASGPSRRANRAAARPRPRGFCSYFASVVVSPRCLAVLDFDALVVLAAAVLVADQHRDRATRGRSAVGTPEMKSIHAKSARPLASLTSGSGRGVAASIELDLLRPPR